MIAQSVVPAENKITHEASRIVIWTLVGYPLLGVLVAYTTLPSIVASASVRGVVFVTAMLLILRLPQQKFTSLGWCLVMFLVLYLVRLVVDLVQGVAETELHLLFFVVTALVPMLAVARVPFTYWDEFYIAKGLAVFGFVTSIAAISANFVQEYESRSLLELTGRLSFDTVNPITLGHVAVTTMIAVVAIYRSTGIKKWLLLLPAAAIMLYMSASRGPVAALAIIVCAIFFYSLRGRAKCAALCAALAMGVAAFFFVDAESEMIRRLVTTQEDQSTTERMQMQTAAIGQFIESPLIGSAHVELESLTYPHNPIVESAMALGIIGLGLFVVLTLGMAARIVKKLQSGGFLMPILGLQYLIAAQLSGSLYSSADFWVLSSILVLAPNVEPKLFSQAVV